MIRLAASVAIGALCAIGLPVPATAGATTYDFSSILFQAHPFTGTDPMPPAIAAPVPSGQAAAPRRVPVSYPSSPSPLSQVEPAAGPPPVSRKHAGTRSLAAAPPSAAREGLMGILSEVRVGILAHDHGPFSSHEEDGIDGNFELLFISPAALDFLWSPRPHVGLSVNSDGNTSQAYFGLSWEWTFLGNWFAGFSLGGSVHDGETTTAEKDRKELGCHLLFRESIEVGYRFGGRHGISAFLDHISNARLCDANEGLETTGIRYGYRF